MAHETHALRTSLADQVRAARDVAARKALDERLAALVDRVGPAF
jgi:hypothetical protein